MTLPFDLIGDEHSHRSFRVAQFLALPIEERVGLVLQRRLRFWSAGVEVERRVALKALMELSRQDAEPEPR